MLKTAEDLLQELGRAVRDRRRSAPPWRAGPPFGDAAGVTKASAKEIATAHMRVWAAFDV